MTNNTSHMHQSVDLTQKVKIADMQFNNFTLAQARQALAELVLDPKHNQCHQVVIANAWSTVISTRDPEFNEICKKTEITFADGQSIVWGSKILGTPLPERVAGPDFMWPFLEDCQNNEIKCYFLGSTEEHLEKLKNRVDDEFPNVWAGGFSPPFGTWPEEVQQHIITDINQSGAAVLWVGIGSPKQDKWISKYKDQLNCKLAFGVGAAFDFYSGNVKRAPQWIINMGLEWLHRLFSDPKRLWKRYFFGNLIYLKIILNQKFGK